MRYAEDDIDGIPSFVVPVLDRDCIGIIDYVAFACDRPDLFGSRYGHAFALNEPLLDCTAALFGKPLPVYRTPRECILAGGDGIVILQPGMAHARIPSSLDLYCQDEVFAEQVKRWRQPPIPTGRVFFPRQVEVV